MSESATLSAQKDDEGLGEKKLKLAGYSYLLGDAALAASGIVQGKSGREVFATGSIWAAGGAAAALWGNPSAEKKLELLASRLEAFLAKNGATLSPEERQQFKLLPPDTLVRKIEHFLYEHPTEILNAAYAVGAGILLREGTRNFDQTSGKIHAAMGGLILTGALGGLLIKEDTEARQKVENGSILDKTIAAIKEKPMRFSSAFYGMNNVFTVANAFADRKLPTGKLGMQPHWFSFLTAASYIVANGLLFFTSRDQVKDKGMSPDSIAQLQHLAGKIIANQPSAVQHDLIDRVAEFMVREKSADRSAPEVAQLLTGYIAELNSQRGPDAGGADWRERVRSGEVIPEGKLSI